MFHFVLLVIYWFLIGPTIGIPISHRIEWDLRATVGFPASTFPGIGFQEEQRVSAFAYGLGTIVRFHSADRVSLLLSADYFKSKPDFDLLLTGEVRIIAIGIGAAYRFS